MAHTEDLTTVERRAVAASPFDALYPPTEKIKTIVVENFPGLGKLAAMRFIEWVQEHPEGVISLPTGKTPQYFIRWVQRLVQHWDEAEIQRTLAEAGVNPACKPDLRGLHFVQIDEFYPIDPQQDNSFYSYVNRFYIDGFGLDPAKALLINCAEIGLRPGQSLAEVWPDGAVDLSLRHRPARTLLEQVQQDALQRIDQWCLEYEERIRALGGIGFFLGGIGPDGHIGFNVRGSDHFSTTRLTEVNYETQAAAAADLGGMEVARKRLVITIGLGTIAARPDACAVIIAAGEAKAGIVAAAIEEAADVRYPASVLHSLPRARFYITRGAAKLLRVRQRVLLQQQEAIDDEAVEKIIVELAGKLGKKVVDLTEEELAQDELGAVLLQRRAESVEALTHMVRDRLIGKIERGCQTLSGTRFLHTEPHHDDLMLGYLPYIVRHVRDATNVHYFVCFTGGFTAVTNRFIEDHIERLRRFLPRCAALLAEGYFAPSYEHGRNRDVWLYLDGVAADDPGCATRGWRGAFCGTSSRCMASRIARALRRCWPSWMPILPAAIPAKRTRHKSRPSKACVENGRLNARGVISGGTAPASSTCDSVLHGRSLHQGADGGRRCAARALAPRRGCARCGQRGAGPGGQRPGHSLQGVAGRHRGPAPLRAAAQRRAHQGLGLSQCVVPLRSQRGQYFRAGLAQHALGDAERVYE